MPQREGNGIMAWSFQPFGRSLEDRIGFCGGDVAHRRAPKGGAGGQ
jgi:hypothetical protein